MKKYILIKIVAIILSAMFLSGCNQETNKEKEDSNIVELLWHRIDSGGTPPYDFKEVVGQIINNDTKDYNKVEVTVYFLDKNDKLIHSGTYTIYDLLQNYTANFFVHYNYLDPNFADYDHYTITLKVE